MHVGADPICETCQPLVARLPKPHACFDAITHDAAKAGDVFLLHLAALAVRFDNRDFEARAGLRQRAQRLQRTALQERAALHVHADPMTRVDTRAILALARTDALAGAVSLCLHLSETDKHCS